jgi:hypothetical protein
VIRIFATPALALTLAVALPLFVPQLFKKEEAAPPPNKVPLTIRLEGPDGTLADPAYARLTAVGRPPRSTRTSVLRDGEGLHPARIRGAPARARDECRKVPLRATGLEGEEGAQPWCLRLTGMQVGYEVTGDVSGRRVGSEPLTVVAVTASRRDAFWGQPLLVFAGGVLAGILAGWFLPALFNKIDRVRLSFKVRGSKIEDLGTWVEKRRRAGQSAAQVLKEVSSVDGGPAAATRERRELKSALSGSSMPPTFAANALEEANRTSHKTSDFLDDNGKRVVHPATSWLAAATRLTQIRAVLNREKERIDELIADCRKEPGDRLREAEETWNALEKHEDVDRMTPRLTALRTTIENVRARPECQPVRTAGAEAVEPLPLPGLAPTPEPLLLRGLPLWLTAGVAIALSAIVVAIILASAGWTTYDTVYRANNTFGLQRDYINLGLTAFASGAVAGVLGIFSRWGFGSEPAAS